LGQPGIRYLDQDYVSATVHLICQEISLFSVIDAIVDGMTFCSNQDVQDCFSFF